jgi:hypothetical protein
MKKITLSITIMFLILALTPALAALGQGGGQEYIVQIDDTLKKIAEKFYGDPLAWPGIWEATNAKASQDSSFATIDDPNVIDAGQKLWIPVGAEAGQLVSTATEKLLVDVAAMFKISDSGGNFHGALTDEDSLGTVASLGDVDGDGVADLAVGAPYNLRNPDVWNKVGGAWVLLLNPDGSVKARQRIDRNNLGIFGGDAFAISVAGADFNQDGRAELVVGAAGDNGSSNDEGAVWVLFLNPDGSLGGGHKIGSMSPDFANTLDHGDVFGVSVANLGDLNGDGVPDLAVGAPRDDDGGTDRGAVWVLFMNSDGTVKSYQKISSDSGGFSGELQDEDNFGTGLANLGDLNQDGVTDLAVGATLADDGGHNQGAIWVLFMNSDGTVSSSQKISATSGGFLDVLDTEDGFGTALAGVGDLNGDGSLDLAVGVPGHDGSGAEQGAIYLLYLNKNGTVSLYQKIGPGAGFNEPVYDNDGFGAGLASLEGQYNLAVGVPGSDDGGVNKGAIWLLSLK